MQFFNGYGGFSEDGREYVMRIACDVSHRSVLPPLPWTNVIANPRFGCIVSETGAGTAWSGNSREYRLTPWSNDPVTDPHGDAVYVRDVDTGEFWCPTPGPARWAPMSRRATASATRLASWRDGLEHEMTVPVPAQESLRVTRLRIRNVGTERHRLGIRYNRWVLGSTPEATRPHLHTEFRRRYRQARLQRRASGRIHRYCLRGHGSRGGRWLVCGPRELGVPGSTARRRTARGRPLVAGSGCDPCASCR